MRGLALKTAALFLLVAALSGCGYHISGKTGRMPGKIENLTIPIFENRTAKPDIESALTVAFVEEFVTTVSVHRGAAHVMHGVITSYELTPVSFTKSDISQEYRLTVVMDLSIENKTSGKVIWKEEKVTDYEDFTVNISDVTETTESEAAALKKLARDTARLVKERMLERF